MVVLINSDALGASDLAAKLLGLPAAEHKRVAVDPKVYDGYAGNYGVSSTVMGIVREGDHLFVRLHGHLWTFARQLRINGCEPRTGARLPSCRRTPVRRTGNLPGRTNAPCRAASRWKIRKSMTPKWLAQYMAKQPAAHRALVAHAKKPQVPYVPAANAPLNPISTTTTITAHVSPDAGLVTLEAFLGGTTNGLVIGMYDFTSGDILKTFEDDLARSKTLQMVLDNTPLNPTHDQTDTQTVEELDKSLGKRASIVRALDRADTLVSAWMFPYAYHIKVIGRDGAAFWLSSGNLNNSNQPDLTKFAAQNRRPGLARHH